MLGGGVRSCWMEHVGPRPSVFSFYGKLQSNWLLPAALCLSYSHDYQSSHWVSEQTYSIYQKASKFLKHTINKLFIKIRRDIVCFPVANLWNISTFLNTNISTEQNKVLCMFVLARLCSHKEPEWTAHTELLLYYMSVICSWDVSKDILYD